MGYFSWQGGNLYRSIPWIVWEYSQTFWVIAFTIFGRASRQDRMTFFWSENMDILFHTFHIWMCTLDGGRVLHRSHLILFNHTYKLKESLKISPPLSQLALALAPNTHIRALRGDGQARRPVPSPARPRSRPDTAWTGEILAEHGRVWNKIQCV